MRLTRKHYLAMGSILLLFFAVLYFFHGETGVSIAGHIHDTDTGRDNAAVPGNTVLFIVDNVGSYTYGVIPYSPSTSSSSACHSSNNTCPNPYYPVLPSPCSSTKPISSAFHGDGGSFSSSDKIWWLDEIDTFIGTYTGYGLYGVTSSYSPTSESDLSPFSFDNVTEIDVKYYAARNSDAVAYPVIGICADDPGTFSASYSDSVSGTYSLSINGRTYTCRFVRVGISAGSSRNGMFTVQNPSGSGYVLVSNTCWTKKKFNLWSSYCNDSRGYDLGIGLTGFQVIKGTARLGVLEDSTYRTLFSTNYNGIGQVAYDYYNGSSSISGVLVASATVFTSAAPGSYVSDAYFCPEAICSLFTGGCASASDTSSYSSRYHDDAFHYRIYDRASAITVSTTVSNKDDRYGFTRIAIDGDYFDKVVLSDSCSGSLRSGKTTLYPSDFTCTTYSSGVTCVYDTDVIWDSPLSGDVSSGNSRSCTVAATLYVDGSSVDSKSSTLNVYGPSIATLDVPNSTSASVQWTVKICGSFDHYDAYVDGHKIGSYDVSPSSAGGCVTDSRTVSSDYVTPGTHTFKVTAYTEDGGESATRSATFSANYTYNYDITDFTVSQSEYHVTSNTATVSGNVNGQTSDPDGAYVSIKDGSTEIYHVVVNGVFTKTWSASLSCGQHNLVASISPNDNHADVKDSLTATTTVYCWSASVGPSGAVQVPSQNGNILPSARITLYYDVSVNPSTDYTATVTWNGQDISSFFQPGSGHTAVAQVGPSDVTMSCGQTVNLSLTVKHNSTTVATASSSFTINCVEQYVIIKSPVDGAQYDTFGSADPDPDFKVPVAVDYAGGDTLRFYVNGTQVDLASASCSDYNISADACYTVSGSQLQRGDNILRVALYNGSTLIADDNVTFTVYAWSFAFVPTYGSDSGVLSVKEYGSHAQSCSIEFPDLNVSTSMLYSDADSQWDYPVDKATYDGKDFNITCYSPTGRVVYTYADKVSFGSGGTGGGTGGGGGGGAGGGASTAAPAAPRKPEVVPFWPDYSTVGAYQWSVIDKQVFLERFTSAAVSNSLVCVQPREGVVSVKYCPVSVSEVPAAQDGLSQVIDTALHNGCSAVQVKYVGDFQCVDMKGSGIYEFVVGGDRVRVLVAGSSTNFTFVAVAGVVSLVVVALIYAYVKGWI